MRYAIYFIPDPSTPLWAFGSSVIGYDSAAGTDVPLPAIALFRQPEAREWTEAPRRYGFHATLKAPFELADGTTPEALVAAAAAFAAEHDAVDVGPLAVTSLDGFAALVPVSQPQTLTDFAFDCVTAFEPFRAPLSASDRERRLQAGLSPEQIADLDRWGYPHVGPAFQFHMTLTGRLTAEVMDRVLPTLTSLYAPIASPLRIDAIAVCRQASRDARFSVVRRHRLRV